MITLSNYEISSFDHANLWNFHYMINTINLHKLSFPNRHALKYIILITNSMTTMQNLSPHINCLEHPRLREVWSSVHLPFIFCDVIKCVDVSLNWLTLDNTPPVRSGFYWGGQIWCYKKKRKNRNDLSYLLHEHTTQTFLFKFYFCVYDKFDDNFFLER